MVNTLGGCYLERANKTAPMLTTIIKVVLMAFAVVAFGFSIQIVSDPNLTYDGRNVTALVLDGILLVLDIAKAHP
jgi:hypothetical protein